MIRNKKPCLYVVLPCFNEEENVETAARQLRKILSDLRDREGISHRSSLLFIDDGSTDATWEIINSLHAKDKHIEGIRLSKNKGHQTAIFAGIEYAVNHADIMITMDSDMQQDPDKIPYFIEMYLEGYDVVYGIRNDRSSDGVFKKASAILYYKLMNLLDCEIKPNSADYRMLSKQAGSALVAHQEGSLFLRGLIPTLGFRTGSLYFDVKKRQKGSSKYTMRKMVRLAVDGITSFSIMPIHLVFYLGMFILAFSVVMMIYSFIARFFFNAQSGWASLSIAIWFLGGAQLTSLGVIGEYVGKTYMESKHRPRYFIEDTCVSEGGRDENLC